jgi:hypothetical protein
MFELPELPQPDRPPAQPRAPHLVTPPLADTLQALMHHHAHVFRLSISCCVMCVSFVLQEEKKTEAEEQPKEGWVPCGGSCLKPPISAHFKAATSNLLLHAACCTSVSQTLCTRVAIRRTSLPCTALPAHCLSELCDLHTQGTPYACRLTVCLFVQRRLDQL